LKKCSISASGGTDHTDGLPLPMGGNAIRRKLAKNDQRSVRLADKASLLVDNREDALQYAMQFARDMDPALADRFVAMWVNDLTLDYSERGREAVPSSTHRGHKRGIIHMRKGRVRGLILPGAATMKTGRCHDEEARRKRAGFSGQLTA